MWVEEHVWWIMKLYFYWVISIVQLFHVFSPHPHVFMWGMQNLENKFMMRILKPYRTCSFHISWHCFWSDQENLPLICSMFSKSPPNFNIQSFSCKTTRFTIKISKQKINNQQKIVSIKKSRICKFIDSFSAYSRIMKVYKFLSWYTVFLGSWKRYKLFAINFIQHTKQFFDPKGRVKNDFRGVAFQCFLNLFVVFPEN